MVGVAFYTVHAIFYLSL